MKESLASTLHFLNTVNSGLEILTLHQECGTIKINECVLGSSNSSHTTSSLVMVDLQCTEEKLAEIQYFVKCDVKLCTDGPSTTKSYGFAAVKLCNPQPCKVRFGSPVEVWTRVLSPNILFHFSHIKCKVAYYASATVNFGRFIGNDSVFVVAPLSNH